MIGDNQDVGIVVEQLKQRPDFLVDIRVIVVDQRLVGVSRDEVPVRQAAIPSASA